MIQNKTYPHLIYIVTLMAAVTLLMGCGSSDPEVSYQKGGGETAYTAPIMVSLRPQAFFTLIASRGTGSFTKTSIGLKAPQSDFYVLAYRNGADAEDGLNDGGDYSKTTSSDADGAYCLMDGGHQAIGQLARLVNDSTGAMDLIDPETGNTTRRYYSKKYPMAPNDFYAYYTDDHKVSSSEVHRDKDQVYVDLTVDGAQDVMVGCAAPVTDSLMQQRYGKLTIAPDVRRQIVGIGKYSTLAAQHDVQPVIDLKHVLTKIRFEAIAADTSANQVCIRGITLTGCVGGRLVVADKNTGNVGLHANPAITGTLRLREPSPDGTTPGDYVGSDDRYQMHWADSLAQYTLMERPAVTLGESIMLPPANSYKMGFDYYLFHPDEHGNIDYSKPHLFHSDYIISAPTDNAVSYDAATKQYIFRPGYEYVIRIACYGYKECEVSASTTGWIKSENIEVDQDK